MGKTKHCCCHRPKAHDKQGCLSPVCNCKSPFGKNIPNPEYQKQEKLTKDIKSILFHCEDIGVLAKNLPIYKKGALQQSDFIKPATKIQKLALKIEKNYLSQSKDSEVKP